MGSEEGRREEGRREELLRLGLYTEWKNVLNRSAFSESEVALAVLRKTVEGMVLLLKSDHVCSCRSLSYSYQQSLQQV